MARVFQADQMNPAEYFLAQARSSGSPEIHSSVECDGLRFDTARIFYSTANFDMQALFIQI